MSLAELGFIRPLDLRDRWIPSLPVYDTHELMAKIPNDKWALPTEPYTHFEKIDPKDLDFIKDGKRKRFTKWCQEEIVSPWMGYLKAVERGERIARRAIEEGIISGSLNDIESYNFFYNAMRSKIISEQGERCDQRVIDSCRRAFSFLLTDEQNKRLKVQKPEELEDGDTENARLLVTAFRVHW